MNIGIVEGEINKDIVIPISFEGASKIGVNSCEFILSFDPDVINVEEVIAGNIIEHSAASFGTTINSEEGTIRFIFSDEIESGSNKCRW